MRRGETPADGRLLTLASAMSAARSPTRPTRCPLKNGGSSQPPPRQEPLLTVAGRPNQPKPRLEPLIIQCSHIHRVNMYPAVGIVAGHSPKVHTTMMLEAVTTSYGKGRLELALAAQHPQLL